MKYILKTENCFWRELILERSRLRTQGAGLLSWLCLWLVWLEYKNTTLGQPICSKSLRLLIVKWRLNLWNHYLLSLPPSCYLQLKMLQRLNEAISVHIDTLCFCLPYKMSWFLLQPVIPQPSLSVAHCVRQSTHHGSLLSALHSHCFFS